MKSTGKRPGSDKRLFEGRRRTNHRFNMLLEEYQDELYWGVLACLLLARDNSLETVNVDDAILAVLSQNIDISRLDEIVPKLSLNEYGNNLFRHMAMIIGPAAVFGMAEAYRKSIIESGKSVDERVLIPWLAIGPNTCPDCQELHGQYFTPENYPAPLHHNCVCVPGVPIPLTFGIEGLRGVF